MIATKVADEKGRRGSRKRMLDLFIWIKGGKFGKKKVGGNLANLEMEISGVPHTE